MRIASPRQASFCLLLALLLSIGGCADEEQATPSTGAAAGESCQTGSDCQTGLLCVGLVCRDPNAANNGNNGNNGGSNNGSSNNNGSNNGDSDAGATNNGVADTGDDVANNGNNGEPDVVDDGGNNATRPAHLSGGISLFEVHVTTGNVLAPEIHRGNAGAAFVEPTNDPAPALDTCVVFQSSSNTPPGPMGYDAGSISVTGGRNTVTLTPANGGGGSVTYSAGLDEANENVFEASTNLTVSAAGGAHIPAFQGTLTTPAEHRVTQPAPDSTQPDAIDVVWTNSGSSQSVLINVIPLDNFYHQVNGPGLNCALSSDSGSFTIPASATSQMSSARAAVSVIKAQNTDLTVGPDSLILNATYSHGVVIKLQ